MHVTSLELLSCPVCQGPLTLDGSDPENPPNFVQNGMLVCTTCAVQYPIRKGIPNLLSDQLLEDYKKQEMQGWVNLWQKKGMYERPTLEHSFQLPYLQVGVWIEVARMFDMAMDEMNLRGGEVILDMGAGQGWASRYFAAKGCRVVATDIVDDEWYGLGRAWAIMDKADVYFEPMLADGENLPFAAGTFDVVFFCGALHHFRDSKKVLAQVYKVLKLGGRLIATGEPSIAIPTPEKLVQAQLDEVDEGIVERRPKVWEYWQKVRWAGFGAIRIDTYETYKQSPADVMAWIKAVRANLTHHVRLRFKPFVWLGLTLISLLPHRWAGTLTVWINGGNLFIRGTKPS